MRYHCSSHDISSVTTLSRINIHFELIPNVELIRSQQNNLHNALPTSNLMHHHVTQLTALVLSHQARTTGQGLSKKFVSSIIVNAVQKFTITEENSRSFMLIEFLSFC